MSIAHIGLADSREPGDARSPERTPPHDLLAEQSALGGMLLSKDAVADVVEVDPRHRLLHPQARDHLRRDPVALLARRADRRHHRHRRADQDRRALAGRRRRVPAHPHQPRAHRRERRLLRQHRRREGAAAPPGRGGHPHHADGLQGRGRGARPRQQRAGRDLLGHRHAGDRGLRPADRGGDRRDRRDRGGQAQGRLDDRRPHRLRRARRADQRPPPRSDGDRRGAPRAR